jgi:hypothetical protein
MMIVICLQYRLLLTASQLHLQIFTVYKWRNICRIHPWPSKRIQKLVSSFLSIGLISVVLFCIQFNLNHLKQKIKCYKSTKFEDKHLIQWKKIKWNEIFIEWNKNISCCLICDILLIGGQFYEDFYESNLNCESVSLTLCVGQSTPLLCSLKQANLLAPRHSA